MLHDLSAVQLTRWLAAGREKTRRLKEIAVASHVTAASQTEAATEETPPLRYVGILVIEHIRNLSLALKAADGAVIR